MTGKIQFKMRSGPVRPQSTPTSGPPVLRTGNGSFDDEAMAALEAVLGPVDGAPKVVPEPTPAPMKPTLTDRLDNLEASLVSAPLPEPVPPTSQPPLRTVRELLAAMDADPGAHLMPAFARKATLPQAGAEPPSPPRPEQESTRPQTKELRNGDLPKRVVPMEPDRPRRTAAPQLEPPEFELMAAKPHRLRWPFRTKR